MAIINPGEKSLLNGLTPFIRRRGTPERSSIWTNMQVLVPVVKLFDADLAAERRLYAMDVFVSLGVTQLIASPFVKAQGEIFTLSAATVNISD